MTTQLKVLFALLVFAIGLAVVVTYNRAVARVATLETANEQLTERIASAEAKAAQMDELIAAKVREELAIRQRRSATNRAVTEAAHEDQTTRDYLSAPIPQRLRDVWRNEAAAGERAGADRTDGGGRAAPKPH